MGSGTITPLVIVAAVLVLFITGILLVPGISFQRQDTPTASGGTENECGIGCPIPADIQLKESDANLPAGFLPALDQRVRAAGKTLETATLGLG